jgi:hypothetical protein
VRAHALAASLIAVSLLAAACDAYGDDSGTDGTFGGPTGIGQSTADVAMGGLCDIASGDLTEMAEVHEAFHGRAHEALHTVAAEVQEVDPAAAAALLEAKAVVEADLEEAAPPAALPAHAQALVVSFGTALEAIGLRATACAAT